MTVLQLSDTRATPPEAVRQLWDGLRVFGLGSQPATLARIALGGLPRHGMTVAGAIAVTARVRGDQVALLDDRGAVTYAELGRATDRLAAALDPHRLAGPGTRVAVVCHDDRDLFIAAAAAGLTGAQVAQLSPRMGRAAFASWLAGDSAVDLILYAPEAAGLIDGHAGRTLATTDVAELVAATPPGHPVPNRARRSASVMITSGTTGVPKGIAIGRRADQPLAAFALAGATRIRPGVPTLVWPPLHHGYGLAAAMLCLVVGSPVVTASALPRASLADGAGVVALQAIRRYGVEVVFGVPAQLRALADALAGDNGPPPRLRAVLSGSDALDQATVAALQQALGPVLVNFYGSTEAGTFAMATGAMVATEACVGRPIIGTRVQIVGEDGNPVPVGAHGRVRVRSLMASVTDEPGSRWLTMNDLGYLDARGRLHILGRAGPVARLGGEFIEPAMVQTLLAGLPGVLSASVEVATDGLYGRRLTAAVVPMPGLDADPQGWRLAIREALGPAAVPRDITVLRN
ncbi:MAG: AMP-binding protein [Propionibacteriaceae bacterium]|nr:AMP-binding protein [Propionibacteriaceae bacterium]